jgi:hypothetical protein
MDCPQVASPAVDKGRFGSAPHDFHCSRLIRSKSRWQCSDSEPQDQGGRGCEWKSDGTTPAPQKFLFLLAEVGQSRARQADQRSHSASVSDRFRRIVAMAEGILVADGSTASGGSAMHPTAAFAAHRWRLARVPAPGPGCAAAYPCRWLLVRHHAGSLDFFAADESTAPTMA